MDVIFFLNLYMQYHNSVRVSHPKHIETITSVHSVFVSKQYLCIMEKSNILKNNLVPFVVMSLENLLDTVRLAKPLRNSASNMVCQAIAPVWAQ